MQSIIEKTKEVLGTISENVNDLLQNEKNEVAQEFKEATADRANAMLEEITQLAETINKAGFEVAALNITVGLPPVFAMNFTFVRDISEEEEETLLENYKDKKISIIILKTLFKSTLYAQKLKMGEFKLSEVDIELGIIPDVILKFTK